MTTRVANGGAAAGNTSSPPQVEERKPAVALPQAQPQKKPEARDRFEYQSARHTPFQTSVTQPRTNLKTVSLAELMRTGSASVPSTGQAEKLVKEAYAEVMMREPDAGGAQMYKEKALDMARNGASEAEIRDFLKKELAGSPEGQVISAVNQQFQSELGRTPESKGHWHEQALAWHGQGASMEEINQRLNTALHESPERALQHPQEFLEKTYQRLLGRSVDGEGVATFEARMREMNAAGASFEDIQKSIEQDIMASPEYQTRKAQQASSTSSVGGLAPSDQELAARVNAELEGTGLAGKGETIVAAARKERVPIDLMMSMLQKESSFLSKENNLSIANNNPGNLRWADWEAEFGGKPGGPGNFTTFPSVDKGIEAMANLLGDVYREEIDNKDYKALVYKYCPPSDQPGGEADSALYAQQMNEWTKNWQQKLGVDDNWINTPPAGGSAPGTSGASGTAPSTGGTSPASLRGITPSQVTDAAGFSDQWSLCGPIAAVAASRATGKPVSLEEARNVALQGGNYTPGDGMHGPDSEVRLLKDLGIPAHTESPVNWDKVKEQLAAGKPVILSTPKHYFVIEGYNEKTGKFDCGNSALAMKASGGTQTELSPSELANWGGGAPTAIILD